MHRPATTAADRARGIFRRSIGRHAAGMLRAASWLALTTSLAPLPSLVADERLPSPEVTYTAGQKLIGRAWTANLMDIDADGVLDAYFDGAVWRNDGHGRLRKTDLSFGPEDAPAYFADFDGDGYVDVLCDQTIHFNDELHRFARTTRVPCDIRMVSASLVDLNGKGVVDIIAGDQYHDRILANDGQGRFTDTGRSLGGWCQSRYAVGDINGDGVPDVYVAIPHVPPEGGHTPNLICLGDRHGGFAVRPHDVPSSLTRDVALGDLNGDGSPDLVLSDQGDWGGTSKIFFNAGNGTFTDSGQNLGARVGAVRLSDVDDDGHPDLIAAGGPLPLQGGDLAIKVWLNDGQGRFIDSGLRLGNTSTFSFDVGDLDGDGRADIMATHVMELPSTTFADVWLRGGRAPSLRSAKSPRGGR